MPLANIWQAAAPVLTGMVGDKRVCPHVRKSDIRSTFETWDKEKRGCLSKNQLKCAMLSLFGRKPSKAEVLAILAASFDQMVDLAMFERLMLDRVQFVKPQEHFRSAFEALVTRKGQAAITLEEFLSTLKKHAPLVRRDIASQAFAELDLDHDGCLKYEEFMIAMAAT